MDIIKIIIYTEFDSKYYKKILKKLNKKIIVCKLVSNFLNKKKMTNYRITKLLLVYACTVVSMSFNSF